MRTVVWKEYSPVGDGQRTCTGSLDKFVQSGISIHVSLDRVLPSRRVLNHLLNSGENRRGMGGTWEWVPFQLAEEEYDELANRLTSLEPPPGSRQILVLSDLPDWVEDERDFTAYLCQLPQEQYVAIATERKKLESALRETPDAEEEIRERIEQLEMEEISLYPEKSNLKLRIPPIRTGSH